MRLVLCACDIYLIDPEHSNYVRNGRPVCHEATCAKVAANRNAVRVPLASHEEMNHAAG